MLQAGSGCTSSIPKDALTAGCAAWCSVRQKTSHCEFCKCRSCEFCVPVESIDHVYASAGASMVDCDDAIEVSPPLEEVSIDTCKAACDDAFPECLAFDYSGRGGRCTLRVGDGEPISFCVQPGASTFWRVEVPADADDARVAAANAAEAESEAAAEAAAEEITAELQQSATTSNFGAALLAALVIAFAPRGGAGAAGGEAVAAGGGCAAEAGGCSAGGVAVESRRRLPGRGASAAASCGDHANGSATSVVGVMCWRAARAACCWPRRTCR